MARKIDTFTELAAQVWCKKSTSHIPMDPALAEGIVRTLRRYHSQVRKMVSQLDAVIDSPYNHGRYDAREELLEKLDALKKGR
ncbi:MAG: hypothetical protein OEV08_07485 [Nitrospira sp.]|nr:hypothetical protein [Nitrospira sp.]